MKKQDMLIERSDGAIWLRFTLSSGKCRPFAPIVGQSRDNPLTISDDEVEFIAGSSKSHIKLRHLPRVSTPTKKTELDGKGDLVIDLTDV